MPAKFFVVDLEIDRSFSFSSAKECLQFAGSMNKKIGGGIPRYIPYMFKPNEYCLCLYD